MMKLIESSARRVANKYTKQVMVAMPMNEWLNPDQIAALSNTSTFNVMKVLKYAKKKGWVWQEHNLWMKVR